jgi:bacillolysin
VRKLYSFIIAITLCVFSAMASENKNQTDLYDSAAEKVMSSAEHIHITNQNCVPDFIEFKPGSQITEENFFSVLSRSFNLSASYGANLVSSEKDGLGMEHHRYQITFNGIPVTDGIHIQDGQVKKFNGYIAYHLNIASNPQMKEPVALQKALLDIGATTYRWQTEGEDAHLKLITNNPVASYFPKGELCAIEKYDEIGTGAFHLAWKFDVFAQKPLSRNYVFVDAISGEVLRKDSRLETANTNATAATVYRGSRAIVTDSYNGSYRLRETTRGLGVNTYDMHATTNYASATDFTNATTTWNNVNANLDQYAGDAHWGAEMTDDFYLNTFGRNGIDAAGFALNLYVHYDVNYVNAFWDGQEMNFGDGDNGATSTPLVSLDVAGHEISHGLTQFTANLNYQNESGAMNEAFSDIMGTAVEYYADSTRANWTVGEDLGSPFRSMSNPKFYQQPNTYLGQYWYAGAQDNGGVHTNSGVENYWYYLLSIGGTGTNDNTNTYNVTGIGRAKATAIAWRMQTVYLVPTSAYADARFYSLQAATDLFGACSPEVQSTANAWYACGVGGIYSPTVNAAFANSNTTGCTIPFTVNFTNQSSNTSSYVWYFGDGDTSHATSPSHTYITQGVYSVKLIGSGGCGTDSITTTNLVNISTTNPCVVILPTSGNAPVQTSCTGTIYDDGGPHGAYSDNDNSYVTISPTGAAKVTLSFSVFRIEQNYDYLYVYDGPTISSPLLGSYTGYTLPASVTSTGSSVTVQFISDPGVVDTGFAINWTCIAPTTAPTANFTSSDTTTCSGDIQFYDLSTGGTASWLWNFGDGTTSPQQNPLKTYTANGTYNVSLTATNIIGGNTKVKSSFITVNKPAAPIVVNGWRSGPGSVVLSASTTNNVNWYAGINDTTPIAVANPFSTQSISATTNFYAEEIVKQQTYTVGAVDSTIGAGSYFNGNTQRALRFKVHKPSKIVSVFVYPATTGYRTIQYRDTFGNVLVNRSVYMQAGSGRVNVNIPLTPSTTAVYELGVADSMNMFRNIGGAAYPYNDAGGLVSIIGNNIGTANTTGYYYYFYDWMVEAPDCISERSTAIATVYPLGITEPTTSFMVSVYPNPAYTQLHLNISTDQGVTALVNIRDMLGRIITTKDFEKAKDIIYSFDVSTWASGVYSVEIKTDQNSVSKQIVISK